MLTPQARELLKIPQHVQLPDTLNELYDHWIAGRSYETRFGGGWSFRPKESIRDGGPQHHLEAQAAGYFVCLEHRTAQFWFGLDERFRVYVECDKWVPIASSFISLVEEDALLVASKAKGDRRRGFGTFRSYEEFLTRYGDYLSAFQEVGQDREFARIFRGTESVVLASRFYSDDYAICGIEYF